jgi:hypothetical protein
LINVVADVCIRFLRFRRMHTKEECHNCRPPNTSWHDHHRQSKSYRVLWSQEPLNASRVVSCRRPVPITVCFEAYCEAKAALGTVSAWWFVDRICSGSCLGIQHARCRYRHDRIAHHTGESRGVVCVEAYSWSGTDGRHLQSQQDFRLRGWHGTQLKLLPEPNLIEYRRRNQQKI